MPIIPSYRRREQVLTCTCFSSPTMFWRSATPPGGQSAGRSRYAVPKIAQGNCSLSRNSGRIQSGDGMIFGAAYSHADIPDILKMGSVASMASAVNRFSVASNSSLITAPPTAVNNLTVPTSYSDFMHQTDDGTQDQTRQLIFLQDWESGIDDRDNLFLPSRRRSKPPSSIEHKAERMQSTKPPIVYPVIRSPTNLTRIKPGVENLARGMLAFCTPHLIRADPSISLDLIGIPAPSVSTPESEAAAQATRIHKFKSLLQMPVVPLTSLKKLAWNGIPDELRPIVWQILLGYLPSDASLRVDTLRCKRDEYQRSVKAAFEHESGLDQAVWHQIRIDVPRTNPHLSLYQFEATQRVRPLGRAPS